MKPKLGRIDHALRALAFSAGLAVAFQAGAANADLRYPFELTDRIGDPSQVSQKASCRHIVPPLVDMSGMFTFYAPGATQSVVDRGKMAAYSRRIGATERFKTSILLWLTRYESEPARRVEAAECLQRTLVAWAQAGAMLDGLDDNDRNGRRQAALLTSWTAIAAVNAFQAADMAPWQTGDRAAVVDWFARLSQAIEGGYPELPPSPRALGWDKPTTNHAHWGAAALSMLAIARGEADGVDLAAYQLDRALKTATPDGAMPQELRRGGKALHYQIFALNPMAILVRIVEANGRPLTREQDRRLANVTRFTLDALDDPSILKPYTTRPQEMPKALPPFVELLRDHFRHDDPALSKRLECASARSGPVSSQFIALNITARVGPPLAKACPP